MSSPYIFPATIPGLAVGPTGLAHVGCRDIRGALDTNLE